MQYKLGGAIVSSIRSARPIVRDEAIKNGASDAFPIDVNAVPTQLLQKSDA